MAETGRRNVKKRRVEQCGVEKRRQKFVKSYLNMEKAKTNECKEKYLEYRHLRDA